MNSHWGRVFFARVVSVVLVASLPACFFSTGESSEVEESRRTVDVARVLSVEPTRTVTLTGRVLAAEQAGLSFEVAGRLEYLELDIGDRIAAGEVLAALDKTPYQLALQRAQASEAEAQAQWQEQRLNYQRQSVLRERNMISQSRLDNAEAALEMARSRHESASASLAIAGRDLAQTELVSPFDGSISQRLAEPSERVAPNQVVYEVISDRKGFEVQAQLPENLVEDLEIEGIHRVQFPALGGQSVTARVRHLGSQPTEANSYPVLLKLDVAEELALRSGMTGQVQLVLHEKGDVSVRSHWVKVPLTALRYPGNQLVEVLRVGDDGTLEAVPVTVQSTRGGMALVSGELTPGQAVVSRGVEFVSPRERVAVLGEGPERYY